MQIRRHGGVRQDKADQALNITPSALELVDIAFTSWWGREKPSQRIYVIFTLQLARLQLARERKMKNVLRAECDNLFTVYIYPRTGG